MEAIIDRTQCIQLAGCIRTSVRKGSATAPGRLGGAVLRLAHVAVHDERELRVRPAPRRRAERARRAVAADGVRVQLARRLPPLGMGLKI